MATVKLPEGLEEPYAKAGLTHNARRKLLAGAGGMFTVGLAGTVLVSQQLAQQKNVGVIVLAVAVSLMAFASSIALRVKADKTIIVVDDGMYVRSFAWNSWWKWVKISWEDLNWVEPVWVNDPKNPKLYLAVNNSKTGKRGWSAGLQFVKKSKKYNLQDKTMLVIWDTNVFDGAWIESMLENSEKFETWVRDATQDENDDGQTNNSSPTDIAQLREQAISHIQKTGVREKKAWENIRIRDF